MTTVTLAILHFGEISTTTKCLDSIKELDLKNINLSVLVINNDLRVAFPDIGSDYKKYFHLTVINNKKNTGFSGGHNQGFKYMKKREASYHIILNNDVIVDRNLVKELVSCFERNSDIGAVSPKIYFSKGHEFHKGKYEKKEQGKVIWYAGGIIDWKNLINKHRGVDEVDKGQYDKEEETDFATGACIMFPRRVIEHVGGFDERYFLYYEDGDLNMRILEKGYRIFYNPKAFLWHHNAGSSSSGSNLQDYYITRNRMLFGLTYAPLRTKSALLRESMRILLQGRKWQKIGIRDFYLRRFGKGSYPI